MDWIITTVYSNTQWLYKVIYSNKLFFVDFWTFNHIWSGAFLYLILKAQRANRLWLKLTMILLGYEVLEIMFRIFALNLFKPEIIKDQINDIIFGIIGAMICRHLLKIRRNRSWNKFHLRYPLTSLLTAGTISYLATGFWQHKTGNDRQSSICVYSNVDCPILHISILRDACVKELERNSSNNICDNANYYNLDYSCTWSRKKNI